MMIDQMEHITVWGRAIRPVAFGIMLSMITVFVFYVFAADTESAHNEYAEAVGYGALAVAIMLAAGWGSKNQKLLEWGLLFASGAWVSRWFLLLFTDKWDTVGFYLTGCWIVVTAGTYLAERWYGAEGPEARHTTRESNPVT
jgi:hypothetical protein